MIYSVGRDLYVIVGQYKTCNEASKLFREILRLNSFNTSGALLYSEDTYLIVVMSSTKVVE